MKRRVSFHTLGCKLNFSESSTLAREFEACGYERVGVNEVADVYVINSVRPPGDHEEAPGEQPGR